MRSHTVYLIACTSFVLALASAERVSQRVVSALTPHYELYGSSFVDSTLTDADASMELHDEPQEKDTD